MGAPLALAALGSFLLTVGLIPGAQTPAAKAFDAFCIGCAAFFIAASVIAAILGR